MEFVRKPVILRTTFDLVVGEVDKSFTLSKILHTKFKYLPRKITLTAEGFFSLITPDEYHLRIYDKFGTGGRADAQLLSFFHGPLLFALLSLAVHDGIWWNGN